MSVVKSKQGTNKFDLFDRTSRTAAHTLNITQNPNVFDPDKAREVIAEIRKLAVRIHLLCWRANDIPVPEEDNREALEARIKLEEEALRCCTDLRGLINLAKPTYHLSGRKTRYWMKMVLEVQDSIRGWRTSERKRIK